MASIFTYEPDPPRVASPWLRNEVADSRNAANERKGYGRPGIDNNSDSSPLHVTAVSTNRISRLQAEPQEGPVEYKLHLLLRPRRKFRSTSTGSHVSGSRHSQLENNQSSRSFSEPVADSVTSLDPPASVMASTYQTRHHRLEQLTTQLLWRLQQSSPHHTSSATNTILPSLPEALPELQAPLEPAKLLHGLEESHGALYEIGVSDDGTLVGLAEDEMVESLNNLRAMAACLGCTVEVLREETVGDCEWVEDVIVAQKQRKIRRTGRLLVVEALVKPYLLPKRYVQLGDDAVERPNTELSLSTEVQVAPPSSEQLRITLIGPTMSGKSTLLGTLTTSTLDNGRGKSRLSMLKHRHEISSGMTSSVTQELIGYQEASDGTVKVINYAAENAASWIDIHVAAAGSRLVFISDSAGHPRYRRTTVRGLVGCAPHWTLLCVPADDAEDIAGLSSNVRSPQQNIGLAVTDIDLSTAQLELCLRLGLPLVVVITKLDLASKSGLKNRLTRVLDALKAAGRKPTILPNSPSDAFDKDQSIIEAPTVDSAYHAALPLLNDRVESVPIILTSAVEGTGIKNLHALLHELPITDLMSDSASNTGFAFHVEEVYSKRADVDGLIVSGLLRSGQISVGDTGTLGPFSSHEQDDSEDSDDRAANPQLSHLPTSRSFPGALRDMHLTPPHFQLPNQEWRRFKVISVRNLRLPVHSLLADQVGTVCIVPDETRSLRGTTTFGRVRKGMVLTSLQLRATRSFSAEFNREDLESLAVGNHVVVYVASVRASARVVSARTPDPPNEPNDRLLRGFKGDVYSNSQDDPSENDGQNGNVAGAITAPTLLVTFNFDASKELIMVGDQVLVMPGGGPGLYGGHERGVKGVAGLEGFVGTITETYG